MLRRAITLAGLLAAVAVAAPVAAQTPPYPTGPTGPTDQQSAPSKSTLAPISLRNQTDGVNSQRVLTVAVFCRGPASCAGTATLTKTGKKLASGRFTAAGKTTFKVPLKLKASVFRALHKAKGRQMRPTLTVRLADGTSYSHLITIKI
jgi:hypothetical protein